MKKFICFMLVFAMLFAVNADAAETVLDREDIPLLSEDSREVEALLKIGILIGTDKGLELERNVTRAEAVLLIWRVSGAVFTDIGYAASFEDMQGHWANDAIEKFYRAGYIQGTSPTTFEPDRSVTGKEFTKILLSALGYKDVTVDNAYDLGAEYGVLTDNFTKSVVYNSLELTRSDAARICYSALLAKTPEGKTLYESLIEKGVYSENNFEGLFTAESKTDASFADRLNAQMPKDKNYMFSPLSIKMAFAMAANGAEGETKNEILDALDIDDLNAFNERAKKLITDYEESDLINLKVSNSIWLNESKTNQKFSEEFADTTSTYYNAEASTVDDETAVESINSWVNDATNGKIPSIISDNDFWAALVNAVYFKGAWQNEFIEGATEKGDFTSRDGSVKETDFMHQTDYFELYKGEDGVIIKLPYKYKMRAYDEETNEETLLEAKANISMYLVMSDCENIESLIELKAAQMERRYVNLSMPKFKIEFSATVNEMMKAIGINKAFSKNAEFENMFDEGTMWIDKVLHKTYINVDEKGTEAAAVTALAMAGSSLPPEPVDVAFDKPFAFAVKDDTNNEILFMGEYAYVE